MELQLQCLCNQAQLESRMALYFFLVLSNMPVNQINLCIMKCVNQKMIQILLQK